MLLALSLLVLAVLLGFYWLKREMPLRGVQRRRICPRGGIRGCCCGKYEELEGGACSDGRVRHMRDLCSPMREVIW